MRAINHPTWAAALLIAASLSPAVAQETRPTDGANEPPSANRGPDTETMSQLQERKWMLEQQIELATLRNELNQIQGPPMNESSDTDTSELDTDDTRSDAPEKSAFANPTPERTWVMTQYSRYGDAASATVVSRYGELTVEAGDALGAWTVSAVGPKGVSVENDQFGERQIAFKDSWSPSSTQMAGGSSNGGMVPPPPP